MHQGWWCLQVAAREGSPGQNTSYSESWVHCVWARSMEFSWVLGQDSSPQWLQGCSWRMLESGMLANIPTGIQSLEGVEVGGEGSACPHHRKRKVPCSGKADIQEAAEGCVTSKHPVGKWTEQPRSHDCCWLWSLCSWLH